MKYLLFTVFAILMGMFIVASSTRYNVPVLQGEEEETAEVGEGGGTLTSAISAQPSEIDPQAAPNAGLEAILPYLFDTLVVRDAKGGLVPSVAQNWKTEQDGQVVTMKLRDDVVFHDGNRLNAQAVKFTFDRYKTSGKSSPIYDRINGISEIQAVDDLTVRFTLAEPTADFWNAISSPRAGIISPDSVALAARTGSGQMIGSGPFMRVDSDDPQKIILTRYVGYHWGPAVTENRDATFIENVVFNVIPDSNAQVAALETDQVKAIYVSQSGQWLKLQADSSIQLIPASQTQALGLAVAKDIMGVKIGAQGQMLLNDARIMESSNGN